MARDYNVFLGAGGGDSRNAFGFGRVASSTTTLSNVSGGKKDSNAITQSNLRNVLTVGLGFNIAQKMNEAVGSYTNDKLRQRRIDTKMTITKYGLGLVYAGPLAGGAYIAGDLGYRSIMYGIRLQKRNREAMFNERLSGVNANSGSIYRGDYL